MIADIFMESLEEKIFVETEAPRLWKRFVDDVLAVTKKELWKHVIGKVELTTREYLVHYGRRS